MKNEALPGRCEIKKITRETADVMTFTLDIPGSYMFTPGQFNEISAMGVGEMPISIGARTKDGITHTVRAVGEVTSHLFALEVGDAVGLRGPFGRGWPVDEHKGKDLVLATGGIGLAPLRALIDRIENDRDAFGRVNICYGARTPQDMVFTDLFDRWRAIPQLDLSLTVDRVPPGQSWEHGVGVVTNLFDRLTVDPANSVAFTCGPEVMMRFVAQSLLIRGFSEESVFVSMERRMECGMGKCGHCMIGPKYVCSDGPVFSYAEAKALPHNLIAGPGLTA